MIPEAPELAVRIAEELAASGIPYAIGGALAYAFWGAPRATKDVDVNVFVPADQASTVFRTLARAGVAFPPGTAERDAAERGDARGDASGMRVDVFFDSIPLHASAAARTVEVELLGRHVRILSAEDLTLFKLLFFRGKDLVDVERLVATQAGALDRDYVRRWLVDCVGEGDERVRRWDSLCAAL